MSKDSKARTVSDLGAIFRGHQTFYLFDYNKMTVAQATSLRKTLRRQGSALRVVKNRLAVRAAEDWPAGLKTAFRKPTAVAYTDGDPVVLARALKDFQTANKTLVLKGGSIEGVAFGPERFEEITRLAGKPELLAKIAFLMAAPLTSFLRVLRAPLAGLGSGLSQLRDKKPA